MNGGMDRFFAGHSAQCAVPAPDYDQTMIDDPEELAAQ
jgi:hypothetical protein